jgi:O-glycosyl hydrolase
MNRHLIYTIIMCLPVLLFSCGEKGGDEPEEPKLYTVTIDPVTTYQEMIGFGGSLTWYADRIMAGSYKNEICQLLFEDLGTDMIRFKNNYYPSGYPAVKTTTLMENTGLKTLFDVTNQLAAIARQYNPDIQFLVSSWSPPSALKSNNSLREGTLKKDAGVFMYQAFGEYWNDVLDNLTFNPDYISIQNEPGWVTPDWETCEWRGTETTDFAGYVNAFDAVWNKISARANPPEMVGPEAENIGYSTKLGGNTFAVYSDPVRNKAYLAAYSYHTYNFSASTLIDATKPDLNMIRDNYGNKPCIMTEYSGFSWLNTAWFIIQNVNEANASGYLYWLMAWDVGNDQSMIRLRVDGSYSLSPFYYMMKHFSKNVDRGYDRIKASVNNTSVKLSAFENPAGDKITLVIVNPVSIASDLDFSVAGKTVKSVTAVQSVEGDFYKDLGSLTPTGYITLKPMSVTTVVLGI